MSTLQYIADGYDERTRMKNETLFHVASGKLGVRGCFEEGAPAGAPTIRGTYLNGFCETESIVYNERLCGFPEEKQVIVNLPDAQTIRLQASGENITCEKGTGLHRVLDMGRGVCERTFCFDTAKGRLKVSFLRMTPFTAQELYAVECRVESVDFDGTVDVVSELDPDVRNFTDASDPRVASGSGMMLRCLSAACEGESMVTVSETLHSRRRVLCAVSHDVPGSFLPAAENGKLAFSASLSLRPGETAVFHKYALYRELTADTDPADALSSLVQYAKDGFDALLKAQQSYLDAFWQNARVTVDGDAELQAQLDLCLYGMLCSAGRDGTSNVAAKGLSGEGYEGHYFWDSEIYVFPFFLLSAPEIAKSLLAYRCAHLDDARAHAHRMGHDSGALYPWRTITGSECSSYYPSGSAQYHINGDIARAFTTYYDLTGDAAFLPQTCEVLAETARLWLCAGHWADDGFRIDCVTGPDEYTCIVNNNYYTNAGAAANLAAAARLCAELDRLGGLDALKAKIGLTDEELQAFADAAAGMYFPYGEQGKLIAQDDTFLSKKRWDLSTIPQENFPLLMHYHPLQINRCQVLKQADSVLANYLYKEESPLLMTRSYRYYEQITTHDSSLSNCIYAVMAARLGDRASAWKYFENCVGTDTKDQNGNTKDGLHIANMGGVYMVMTAGFGGLRYTENGVSLFPMLPDALAGYAFTLSVRGSRLSVSVGKDRCTLRVTDGESVTLTVYGQTVIVGPEAVTVTRKARAVLFDLDGVITETTSLHYAAWKRLTDELDIPFDPQRNEQFKGVSRAACLKLLLGWGSRQADEAEFNALLKRKNDYYVELLGGLTAQNVLPGIRDCLDGLRREGIPYCLFSVSKNTDSIIAKIGLDEAFPLRVTGNDIANSKPHYEGYLLAAEKMGIDPRLCIMVEDSEAGIRGALDVSMMTVAVMPENIANADLCVPSTNEVFDALQKLIHR